VTPAGSASGSAFELGLTAMIAGLEGATMPPRHETRTN
jgi:hypothetical protein